MATQLATCNPAEAPAGYYAMLKSGVAKTKMGNICRACDWRGECQKPGTDFSVPSHRCMADPVVSRETGLLIDRKSVV